MAAGLLGVLAAIWVVAAISPAAGVTVAMRIHETHRHRGLQLTTAQGRKYPGGNPEIRSRAAYDQLETYRQLGVLVCKFGLDHHHPAVAAAAAFLPKFQTEAGDCRGIYGHQYTPNGLWKYRAQPAQGPHSDQWVGLPYAGYNAIST